VIATATDVSTHAHEPLAARAAPRVSAASAPPAGAGAFEGDIVPDDQLAAAVEQEVTKRLAGIPRPVYIPATDFLPPKGLVLHATRKQDGGFPHALAIDGFLQFRWLELSRSVATWTDATGRTLPVNNENAFNINRFLLGLSGYVGSEQAVYNVSLFGTTNAGVLVTVVPVGFVGWRVTEDMTLGGGVTQVPGTREWMISSRWPMGVDRSMANTFFRPSYSPGFMSIGALAGKKVFYHAGIYNGIDGGASGLFREGTSMAFSGNVWAEPLGPYGLGYSDMEQHDELALRLGTSGTYARTPATLIADGIGFANPENTVVRLSDGTPIAERDALGPGTKLDQFRYHLVWHSRTMISPVAARHSDAKDGSGTGTTGWVWSRAISLLPITSFQIATSSMYPSKFRPVPALCPPTTKPLPGSSAPLAVAWPTWVPSK
jgi:hypothetical protein